MNKRNTSIVMIVIGALLWHIIMGSLYFIAPEPGGRVVCVGMLVFESVCLMAFGGDIYREANNDCVKRCLSDAQDNPS